MLILTVSPISAETDLQVSAGGITSTTQLCYNQIKE
jgi:hypothetical protein